MKYLLVPVLFAALAAAAAESQQVERGKRVFNQWCQQCHGQGVDKPGTVALQVKYKGKVPARLEERRDLDPSITKHFVRTGVSVMPFFRKTEISDVDLEALAAYLAPR